MVFEALVVVRVPQQSRPALCRRGIFNKLVARVLVRRVLPMVRRARRG